MRRLTGTEEAAAIRWMHEAGTAAEEALCLKAKCGTVIVADDSVIGRGYNAPPGDDPAHRTCLEPYDGSGKPKYDHTCCMHAEWRAIIDALKRNSGKLPGSRLYFTRVDENGTLIRSGEPYCTVCSRLALDVSIAEFHLWQESGVAAYPTDEYNRLSHHYRHPGAH